MRNDCRQQADAIFINYTSFHEFAFADNNNRAGVEKGMRIFCLFWGAGQGPNPQRTPIGIINATQQPDDAYHQKTDPRPLKEGSVKGKTGWEERLESDGGAEPLAD